MIQLEKKSATHLISAYNQMMAEMRDSFKHAAPGEVSMQDALNIAKHQAVCLGEVSAEEAYEIGEYIKRDINDAAEQMMESSAEFYDWLALDIELIERKVMKLFLAVAEHTRIALEQFTQPVNITDQPAIHKRGETPANGNLTCKSCGKIQPSAGSEAASHCTKCGKKRFIQHPLNDS